MSRPVRSTPKYPKQEHIRQALNEWVGKQPSLQESADELGVSYRMLSCYRLGQRWIPDWVTEAMGLTPVEMSEAIKPREGCASAVIRAAVRFVDSVKNRRDDYEQFNATKALRFAVYEYQRLERERNGKI